jgi:hypothetical protein
MTGASTTAAGTAGLVPAPSSGTANRYLRSDGTWSVPPDTTYTLAGLMGSTAKGSATQPVYWNGSAFATTTYTLGKSVPSNAVFTDTTYSAMTGASTTAAGVAGLVPAPSSGTANRYLRSDGTWVVPPDTTYTLAGLMGSTAKGSATQPVYWTGSAFATTTYTLGASVPSGAKFTDTTYSAMTGASTTAAGAAGLVPAPSSGTANRYLRSDGTWSVPPDTNTTYTLAGLMGSTAKGSATQPVYWTGSAFATTSYTLGKSVPSNAVFTDTTYTHPTTAGYKHIPSGGSSGQILKYSENGTAAWADNTAAGPLDESDWDFGDLDS